MLRKTKLLLLCFTLLLIMAPVEARQKVVVIQPGHTVGVESGAVGKSLQEATLNEDVACRLTDELEKRGYKVYLTHCSRPEYADKTLISVEDANSLRNIGPAMNSVHPDLALSIHHNSGSTRASGYEIYWSSYRDFDQSDVYSAPNQWSDGSSAFRDRTPCYVARESSRLAGIVRQAMEGKPRIGYNGTYERDDYLPAHAFAPCILFEGGYLSNPTEEAYIATDEYRNDMAGRLSNAVDEYFRVAPLPTGIRARSEVTNLVVGESAHIQVTPEPYGYPNQDYTIAPIDSDIIEISDDGTVTGLFPGSVVVQIRPADNPDVFGLARVTVYPKTNYSVSYEVSNRYAGYGSGRSGTYAGTIGEADPMYYFTASIINANGEPVDPNELGVIYRAHVSNIGWQGYGANGSVSGTYDPNLQIEGLQLQLTGREAANYNIYYRSQCANYGWCSFATNGGLTGTEGYNSGIEGLEILILSKEETMVPDTSGVQFYSAYGNGLVRYDTHLSEIGWTPFTADGVPSGAEGQAFGVEAFRIFPVPYLPDGSIMGDLHICHLGWQHYDGVQFGTTGQDHRIEAVRLSLTGNLGNQYDIHYQVYVRGLGWTEEAVNGATAGTEGQSLPIDAIKIWVTPK